MFSLREQRKTEKVSGRLPRSAVEIGRTGVKFSYGRVYEEFISKLKGVTGIKTYTEMDRNDPIIGSYMHAIKQLLREIRWTVEGGSEKDAKFLMENMHQMDHSWDNFITNALSMLPYGWAVFEQVYQRRDDGKIAWKKFAPRAQLSLERWDIDEFGDVHGIFQRPAPSYHLFYIPTPKLLHFRTESAGNNPEGRSILRNAFRPWFFKHHIEEFEAIGAERDLVGLPLLKLPEGVDIGNTEDPEVVANIEIAKTLLRNIRRDEQEGILLPNGWELELLKSPGERQLDTSQIINRYNKEIAVTVLAQFIMLGMERTGSYALAKEQTDMFYMCLEGWGDTIASTINRGAVKLLGDLNNFAEPYPYITHTALRHYQLKDLSSYVKDLVGVEALEVDADLKTYLKNYARLSEFREIE